MAELEKSAKAFAITEAIRARREPKSGFAADIVALENALLADIESFDLEAAQRCARDEQGGNSGMGMIVSGLVFPEIVPTVAPRHSSSVTTKEKSSAPELKSTAGSLLDQLRQQAELRRQELHNATVDHTSASEVIDQALKRIFFFLHDLVQQLNVLKPPIPRDFALLERYVINQLVWQEGFADYRTQSHSIGALLERVTFTCRLSGQGVPIIERDGPVVERFRHLLFDYGLVNTCKEFKNKQGYVERAEFEIPGEISVSVCWRADFSKGILILETRNLERLGSALFNIRPQLVDDAFLDDFGRLILGQANQFRLRLKRQ